MSDPLKILILEDVEEDIWLVKRALIRDGLDFQLEEVDTRKDFINSLDNFAPDIVLSDHSLPQFNSIEALKICKQKGLDTPFILVTGTVSEEFAVNCLKEGADDYVLKTNLGRLPSAIRHSIKQHREEKKRKKAELKLRHQNEELLKINSELDTFVYNISHNLRAPLLSALGLVRLAKMEAGSANFDSMPLYCDKIEESVLKLDDTLKEILDYSRNARSDINFQVINFRRIIDDCFDKLKYLPGSSEIEKTVTVRGEGPFASDNYRIRVVFNNLISNALKYHDSSKAYKWIKIDIAVDRDLATITLTDNGLGIDKSYLPKIFQMFYRATEKSEGSGLGLYIVKENIEKLRGNIKVTSELKKGTAFEIILPNQIDLVEVVP